MMESTLGIKTKGQTKRTTMSGMNSSRITRFRDEAERSPKATLTGAGFHKREKNPMLQSYDFDDRKNPETFQSKKHSNMSGSMILAPKRDVFMSHSSM